MAINEARIDRAEAEALARMAAEYDALIEACADWWDTNPATAEERAAMERMAQGAKLAGDDETLAGLKSRWPPEFESRCASLYERGFIGEDGKPRRRLWQTAAHFPR